MIDRYNEVGLPITALEQTDKTTAKPIEDCLYPHCEECDKYHGHYCTVPIAVSKQNFRITADLLNGLDKRISELENIVTEEILRSKE